MTDPTTLLTHDHHLRALARALVRDASAADDLAQDAWLTALERRVEARSWPAWLATVARRLATRERRTSSRRAQREAVVARAEAAPSTAELLEREEARRRVVAARLALSEPLRTTLVLRFLEDLPPRAVAKRMQVPVETVRTRRGLDALRKELDDGFGARERWLSALAPLTRLPRSPLALPFALMSTSTKLALSAAALALLGWFLWPAVQRTTSAGAEAPMASAPIAAMAELAWEPPRVEPEPGAKRESLGTSASLGSTASAAETGALRVHVTWQTEKHAALMNGAGFVVRVSTSERENPELAALERLTDAEGYALFEGLAGGTALVTVDRYFGPSQRAEVLAGETREVTVAIDHGFEIDGLVVDEAQRPVAGAEIWLGKWADLASGALVAHSAADGAFHLAGLNHANLGARARGYRPSKVTYYYAANGALVHAQLVLQSGGGAVAGSVRDWHGAPVAGAVVRIGPSGSREPDAADANWGTCVHSDEAGNFSVDGLAPGTSPVLARKAGFALQRGTVEVPEDGSAELALVLWQESALEGHVHDALGAPVPDALLRVGEDDGVFRATARTQADGSFRVGALEGGRKLTAWIEEAPGSARTEFVSLPGRTETWEAVLDPLGEIRGRVLDERGEPLARWTVRLRDIDQVQEADEGAQLSDASGSFVFANVHDRPHFLSLVQRLDQILVRHNVRPGGAEIVLRVLDRMLPSARIVGSFVDEEGHPQAAQLMAMRAEATETAVESCDPVTGHFELGPYPPGEVQLILRAVERGTLVKEHVLAAGETWDVGEVRLEPEGRLRVRLVATELEPSTGLTLECRPGFFEPFEGTGTERRSPPLAPGKYTLFVSGGEYEEQALPFEIRGTQETVLDVPLRRGWRTPIEVRAPEAVAVGHLRVKLGGGRELERLLYKQEGERFEETLRLPAGTFAVEAWAGELKASGTVVVEPVDREEAVVRLELE